MKDLIGNLRPEGSRHEDRGAILVMVLVFGVIGALFILPILYYTTAVLRAGSVPTDKAEAIELAEGGTWIALSRQGDLYDDCVGGELASSLIEVTTTCEVLANEQLREPSEMPFSVSSLQAGEQVPSEIADGQTYTNPSTSADPAAWLLDLANQPQAGTVWIPELPVRATSSGGTRDTTMKPDTQATGYASCRVFFPGTFDDPIVIAEPTYFASGVYYFTDTVTIRNGADVVVGNGSELGCATDQTAIADAVNSPSPLNMSGYGGTFILGDQGRIVLDDAAGGAPIRFVINQRYVSDLETSVQASESVSIVSVNGDGVIPTNPLIIPGILYVPASTIGIDGSPFAANYGYLPSLVTPNATGAPGAPTISNTLAFRRQFSDGLGRLLVTWDAPSNNGAAITGYTATAYINGDPATTYSCSPATPASADLPTQTSCIIDGLPASAGPGEYPIVTVVASNSEGTSAPSAAINAEHMNLNPGPGRLTSIAEPSKPTGASVVNHTDGINVLWAAPDTTGRPPVNGYRVTVIDALGFRQTCDARFDELNCVVSSFGLLPGGIYDIEINAIENEGPGAAVEVLSMPTYLNVHVFLPLLATTPAPVRAVVPFVPDVLPILDLTTVGIEQVDIAIAGYIAVPQGRILIGSVSPSTSRFELNGGVVAGQISLDSGGFPDLLDVSFDNPIAQKRIRLVSSTDTRFKAESVAVVQVNESGSLAINSWVVQ